MVNTALLEAKDDEKESLLALQSDLHQLIQLTQESLDALVSKDTAVTLSYADPQNEEKTELNDEYALFMVNSLIVQSNEWNHNPPELELFKC